MANNAIPVQEKTRRTLEPVVDFLCNAMGGYVRRRRSGASASGCEDVYFYKRHSPHHASCVGASYRHSNQHNTHNGLLASHEPENRNDNTIHTHMVWGRSCESVAEGQQRLLLLSRALLRLGQDGRDLTAVTHHRLQRLNTPGQIQFDISIYHMCLARAPRPPPKSFDSSHLDEATRTVSKTHRR